MAGSTTYQYILSLNDKMTGALRKAGVEGAAVFNKLQTQQEKLKQTTDKLGGTLSRLFAGAAVVGFVGKIVHAGMEIEQTRIAFQTLMQDVDKGNAMVQQLQDFANVTPFGTTDLQDAAKLMLNFGISSEKIMPTLKMLGDISGGNSNKLHMMTLAFSQMSSAGRLMGQDLLQMINAGFNPLQEISAKTGVSMADLKKQMEKGLITTAMVEEAFKSATSQGGRFYGMMEKMGQTNAGRWSTFLDKMSLAFMKWGDSTNGMVGKIIDKLTSLADWLFKNANAILEVGAALAVGIGVMKAFSVAMSIVNFVMAANPIFWIVLGIAALIAGITYLIIKTKGWGKTWESVTTYLRLSLIQMGEWFGLKAAQIGDDFLSAFEAIAKAWYKVEGLWDKEAGQKGIAELDRRRAERQADIQNRQNTIKGLASMRKGMDLWQVEWDKEVTIKSVTDKAKAALGVGGTPAGGGAGLGLTGGLTAAGIEETSKGITGGGSRPTTINITLGNLVEQITITPASMKEGADELTNKVQEALLRVLNSANGVAYGN